jgi:hypothetical protein
VDDARSGAHHRVGRQSGDGEAGGGGGGGGVGDHHHPAAVDEDEVVGEAAAAVDRLGAYPRGPGDEVVRGDLTPRKGRAGSGTG